MACSDQRLDKGLPVVTHASMVTGMFQPMEELPSKNAWNTLSHFPKLAWKSYSFTYFSPFFAIFCKVKLYHTTINTFYILDCSGCGETPQFMTEYQMIGFWSMA